MLPSPSSPRPALFNRTNVLIDNAARPHKCSFPSPPNDHKANVAKRPFSGLDDGIKKRVKLTQERIESEEVSSCYESDSDTEMEDDMAMVRARGLKGTFFRMMNAAAMARPCGIRPSLSTRPILQSFVSSHKSDVFKCDSTEVDSYLSPPYACSYTYAAKSGGTPLLAIATEHGTVHIVNTSKRKDWELEPQRTTFQPHFNGIFDIKWNNYDTFIATSSGDHTTRISCATTFITTAVLRGHTSTVKCIAWDPNHQDLLSTGGRDGAICLWDLRVFERRDTELGDHVQLKGLRPVMLIPGAHEAKERPKGRKAKKVSLPRSITALSYSGDPYQLISSGSFDGILHCWDIRLLSPKRKTSKPPKPTQVTPFITSSFDPTALHGSRRPRGITSLTCGTGPTRGLLFALGADSRIHTYTLPSLGPQKRGYTHEKMHINSFYVRVATSPCGRWLASGGSTGNDSSGSVFLYDVGSGTRSSLPSEGIELKGQTGEVGALDWADRMLATCADDGSVRVWRPDVDVYRQCLQDPDESKWEWNWSRD